VSRHCVVGATDLVAHEAAEDAALAGASALSAVLTGYFALAGHTASVLLGPMSLLVSGFGATRALDGRQRQPGLGGKRPRGLQPDDVVPDQARIAVPTGVIAALVALGYDKDRKLSGIISPGVALARRAGADARAALLQRIRDVGAGAFADQAIHRPLLHVAGPSEGGMLTSADFTTVPVVDHAAQRSMHDGGQRLTTPWVAEKGPQRSDSVLIGAVDRHGIAAILCCHTADTGLAVPALELLAPFAAEPVRRGVPRTRPGQFLPAPSPIAIELDASGRSLAVRHFDADSSEFDFRVAAPE
jgi:gamma-glutamyltranspeptidase/glutathione hydrolase